MDTQAPSAAAIASARHWMRCFVEECEHLGIALPGVEPDPLALFRGVLDGSTSIEELRQVTARWAEEFRGLFEADYRSALNRVDLLPLRLAILVGDLPRSLDHPPEKAIVQAGYVVDWIADSLQRLGYDTSLTFEIGRRYFDAYADTHALTCERAEPG